MPTPDPTMPTASPRELPPGLDAVLSVGYNARKGTFGGRDILNLTYGKNAKIHYGHSEGSRKQYDVPDQVRFVQQSKQSSLVLDRLLRTEEEFKQAFSIKTEVEGSGIAISAKAHFEMNTTENLFTATGSKYHFAYYFQTVSEYWLNETPLSAGFQQRIAALNPSQPNGFTKLFEDFGTHYLTHGYLGGYMTMITEIKDSLLRSSSTQEIIAGLTVGYNGLVTKGSLSVDVARSSSTFMEKHNQEMSVKTVAIGGVNQGDDLKGWYATCFIQPLPILVSNEEANIQVTMLPITMLVAEGPVRTAMEEALNRYAPAQPLPPRSIFGSAQVWQAGKVEHATSDGFLIGHIWTESNGPRGSIIGQTDAHRSPRTIRGAASMHYYTDSDKWGRFGHFLTPVRKNDYAVTTYTATAGNPSADYRFIPFRDKDYLGQWQSLSLNTPFSATTDGFVVCTIQIEQDGGRGYVFLLDTTDSTSHVRLAATSAHAFDKKDSRYPCQSFCAPVRQGRQIEVKSEPTWGTPTVNAYWIPLQHAALGEAEPLDLYRTYIAETDGLLVGVLAAEKNGARGHLFLKVGRPGSESLGDEDRLGVTSVHYWEASEEWLRYNTTTVPVGNRSVYRADLAEGGSCTLYWVPLIPR